MVFEEGESVYLEGADGRRFWAKVSYSMMKVPSLGALDGSRLRDMDDGDAVSVVGREYTVFRPGAIELMESLDRGAQVITPKDAATILLDCDVKSGDKVIEVGAGSGGMTTALLHAVAPGGHVHTIEFKEENLGRARRNISRTGLDACWSCTAGDAREVSPDIGWKADALVMDMPDPWLAVGNLEGYLRPGGRVCAYVPNMNQAASIVEELRRRGYSDVHALENLQRGLEVHPGGVRPSFEMLGHTGYLVFARKTSGRTFRGRASANH